MEDFRVVGEDFVVLGDWNALPEEGAAGRCVARGLVAWLDEPWRFESRAPPARRAAMWAGWTGRSPLRAPAPWSGCRHVARQTTTSCRARSTPQRRERGS
eukprot:5778280-Alexandrium_andersonii.AAC.1